MTRYTARASRVDDWWMVQCDQHPGALSQVRRLDQAAEVHREAIAFVAQVPIEDVEVDIQPELPADLRAELDNAERLTQAARESETEARRRRREVAAQLARDGLPLRDIGTLLGISHQRVHQLLDDRSAKSA